MHPYLFLCISGAVPVYGPITGVSPFTCSETYLTDTAAMVIWVQASAWTPVVISLWWTCGSGVPPLEGTREDHSA